MYALPKNRNAPFVVELIGVTLGLRLVSCSRQKPTGGVAQVWGDFQIEQLVQQLVRGDRQWRRFHWAAAV